MIHGQFLAGIILRQRQQICYHAVLKLANIWDMFIATQNSSSNCLYWHSLQPSSPKKSVVNTGMMRPCDWSQHVEPRSPCVVLIWQNLHCFSVFSRTTLQNMVKLKITAAVKLCWDWYGLSSVLGVVSIHQRTVYLSLIANNRFVHSLHHQYHHTSYQKNTNIINATSTSSKSTLTS